jgi:hypothetical protein
MNARIPNLLSDLLTNYVLFRRIESNRLRALERLQQTRSVEEIVLVIILLIFVFCILCTRLKRKAEGNDTPI